MRPSLACDMPEPKGLFCVCSIGGAPGVGAFNGLATNVTTLQTDFPTIGLNGTAVNVSTVAAATLAFACRRSS